MTKIYTLLFLWSTCLLTAQNFEKEWEKVVLLENEGKISSADKKVDNIYEMALENKNEVQRIKCFFYKSKYLQTLDESANQKIFDRLAQEKNNISKPSAVLLDYIYVKCLIQYRANYRNRVDEREEIVSSKPFDFKTANRNMFENEINLKFYKLIDDKMLLQTTNLLKYEPVFDYLNIENFQNQTLFDFIINELIDYKTSKFYFDMYEKQNQEVIENLVSDKKFANYKFNFKRADLNEIIGLFQQNESHNQSVDKVYDRLTFLAKHNIIDNEQFISAMKTIVRQTKDIYTKQKIWLEIANTFYKNASKNKNKDYKIKAYQYNDSILQSNKRGDFHKMAFNNINELKEKFVSVDFEKFIYENQNSRALIHYKNVDSVQLHFYKFDFKKYQNYLKETNNTVRYFYFDSLKRKQKPLITKHIKLNNKKDYFDSSTEILLPKLSIGCYFVDVEYPSETEKSMQFKNQVLIVSNQIVLGHRNENETEKFIILDRKTGKPKPNAFFQTEKYSTTSDKYGEVYQQFSDSKNTKNEDRFIKSVVENDTLLVEKSYIYGSYNPSIKNSKVNFYLDRAIYRPGQKVFFKGIAMQKIDDQQKVVPHTSFEIVVEDPENNEIYTTELTTNEFGSFSGEFQIPKNILTGRFSITADEPKDYEKDIVYDKEKDEHPFWDTTYFESTEFGFSVEEYKRPKFEVVFEPVTATYKVGDKITIHGKANSFSGANVSDARVAYQIERRLYHKKNSDIDDEDYKIIDTIKTNNDGSFDINFVAQKSDLLDDKDKPEYHYIINAVVTDSNGETHENKIYCLIGNHLKVNLNCNTKRENKFLEIKTTNLNNQFVGIKGNLKIYFKTKLSSKFKNCLIKRPENKIFSDSEFEKLFPYEQNEDEIYESIKYKDSLVYSKQIDTNLEKTFDLEFLKKYEQTRYEAVFETESDTAKTMFSIESDLSNKLFVMKQTNESPEKDGFIQLKILSQVAGLYINITAKNKGKILYKDTFLCNKTETDLKIFISEKHRDYVGINIETVFENQYFQNEISTFIKPKIEKITFLTQTFRDKITPGTTEKWQFKIVQNQKAETELLASMYDASLDQFDKKDWNNPEFLDYNNYQINQKTVFGFQTENANLKTRFENYVNLKNETQNTNLMWFGFDLNEDSYINYKKNYKQQLENKKKKNIKKLSNSNYITGIVSDNKTPIAGANVRVKGTDRQTQTDFDGYFEIPASLGEQLIVSFIGYKEEIIKINQKIVNINIVESENELSEVVIRVGYGSQKKSSLTGSSVRVVNDNTPNTIQMLQGQVAGISVSSSKADVVVKMRGVSSISNYNPLYILDGAFIPRNDFVNLNPFQILNVKILKPEEAIALYGSKAKDGAIILTTKKSLLEFEEVNVRKKLNETAFFFPHLKADENGNLTFEFETPEALTKWKFRMLAHNKNLTNGYFENYVVTQKNLMITPNMPRFFRENDKIVLNSKITNLSNEVQDISVLLQFFDPNTMKKIDEKVFIGKNLPQDIKLNAKTSQTVSWTITIPENLQGLQYKIIAKCKDFSDGEEAIIPVLSNKILVTESQPIWVRSNEKKEILFDNLKESTAKNQVFKIEYASDPTWLALEALPFLIEFEHECSEQTFARLYANSIARKIVDQNPKLQNILNQWKALKSQSKLNENQDLLTILLAETPWLFDKISKKEQQKRLALLFDLDKMKIAESVAINKLLKKQKPSGGFSWFEGGNENIILTQHIVAGFGHLKKLNINFEKNSEIENMLRKAIQWLDKFNKFDNENSLHYLYARSFFIEKYTFDADKISKTNEYLDNPKDDWTHYPLYQKAVYALALNRFGKHSKAKTVLKNLKESAINADFGMYWKENTQGYDWYHAPIETQALIIEAFIEIENDKKTVEALKMWLIKNKLSKNWTTTKATTEAVYALLSNVERIDNDDKIDFRSADNKKITFDDENYQVTGYKNISWNDEKIDKNLSKISIQNDSKNVVFGGIYWQYLEDLEKIKSSQNSEVAIKKVIYLNKNGKLYPTTNNFKVGDLLTIQLQVTINQDMDYLQIKDNRASCFEPTEVFSKYIWDNTSYYFATKDASTYLFFDRLNKGSYTFNYNVRVNNAGDFMNGLALIQNVYAPEFSSHTKGEVIRVSKE